MLFALDLKEEFGRALESGVLGGVDWLYTEVMGLTLVADGRALKKRWFRLFSSSNSAKTAAEPAQKANDLLWSWLENPLGDDVVVPITVCNASVDWCARDL